MVLVVTKGGHIAIPNSESCFLRTAEKVVCTMKGMTPRLAGARAERSVGQQRET
jgi:hypothetical protein